LAGSVEIHSVKIRVVMIRAIIPRGDFANEKGRPTDAATEAKCMRMPSA
jgi:hypothetical protein